LPFQLLP